VHHEWQGQSLEQFPAVKRWFGAVRERPATQRAYAAGHVRMADAEAYRFLYGQTADSVEQQRKEHER
jgi:GST-like protein